MSLILFTMKAPTVEKLFKLFVVVFVVVDVLL